MNWVSYIFHFVESKFGTMDFLTGFLVSIEWMSMHNQGVLDGTAAVKLSMRFSINSLII